MDSIFKELPIDYHPQQNVFKFDDGVIISSNYDSGNLHTVERVKENLVFKFFIIYKSVLFIHLS